jgi:hypothetical protein
MLVMGPAAQLDVVDRGEAAVRVRDEVMKFPKAAFLASPLAAHEPAPPGVTLPPGPFHGRGNVARQPGCGSRRARVLRARQLRPLQMLDEQGQGAVQDLGRIAVRHDVPQQVLRTSQLVVRLPTYCDLHSVAVRGATSA